MSLYEQLMVLGIIRSSDDSKPASRVDGPGHGETEADEDDKAVRAAFERIQKKKPLLVIGSDDSDSDYYASCESDSSDDKDGAGNSDDDLYDSVDENFDDDMSETQMRNEQAVRHVIDKSKDTMALLGMAEALRQRSQGQGCETTTTTATTTATTIATTIPEATLPAQYFPLTYPTGDVDAGKGFEVCGFKGGKRVYRLESPHVTRLRSMVVKTGVGYCYLDIGSMLPPKVVEVPVPLTPPTTPLGSPSSTTQVVDSFSALAVPASPSSPPLPQHRPQHQPHLHVNGCFAIRPSTLGGLGAFALRELYRGEHILVEEPLLRTTLFHMPHELDKLAPEKRAQFDALTGHHPDPNASTAEKIWTANTFEAGSMEAIFPLASRFNHACTPRNNIGYHFDRRKNVLIMTAIKKIPAGTELLITYGKSPSELFLRFGFRCVCGACTGFTEDMSRKHQLKNWSG